MSIAIAQMRVALADPRQNKEKMIALINRAKAGGAEVIVFPELALCGYLADELVQSRSFAEDCAAAAAEIAAAATGIQVVFGNLYDQNSCAYLAEDGQLHPAAAAVAPGRFSATPIPQPQSDDCDTVVLLLGGKAVRTLLLLGDWRGRQIPDRNAELVIALSPQPLVLSEQPFVPAGVPFIQLGAIGLLSLGKANYLQAGRSCCYDRQGRLVAAAPYFREELCLWNIAGGDIAAAPEGNALLGEALVAGAREFCDSIHVQRAVIGISGGIDSALASCVYRQALGADNVFLVSLPTHFNSHETRSLAQGMAEGLGLAFRTMPIEEGLNLFYRDFDQGAFVSPAGTQRKVELRGAVRENIMARERARYLATAAAGLNAIFTCNGNKAELSVGYATFYGDLAGAFAVQADLWKYQVYAAAKYFHSLFPDAPLDEIAAIRPSAELSDAQDVTKGLGDPLIYAYHDYLLKSWVEAGKYPLDTLLAYQQGRLESEIGCAAGLVGELFKDAAAFIADLEYWWRMYRVTGVAKRLQAPPLLALSNKPFGEPTPQVQGALYYDEAYTRLKQQLLR